MGSDNDRFVAGVRKFTDEEYLQELGHGFVAAFYHLERIIHDRAMELVSLGCILCSEAQYAILRFWLHRLQRGPVRDREMGLETTCFNAIARWIPTDHLSAAERDDMILCNQTPTSILGGKTTT